MGTLSLSLTLAVGPPKKDTAAPAGPRNGGIKGKVEAVSKPHWGQCRRAAQIASTRLAPVWSEDHHLVGWISASETLTLAFSNVGGVR